MVMEPITLVVMAAGMGSRFGGLKQAQPITPDGKGILDFSVYDAKKAGFTDVVFIVREDMKEDFIRLIGNRISRHLPVRYVVQDTTCLPAGRKKPFGTAHAILCCRDAVHAPFAIINADDYYGSHAFFAMAEHLRHAGTGEYAMTAFELGKTLSENGTVSRGVCQVKDGYLESVTEMTAIAPDGSVTVDGKTVKLDPKTPVSMNLWGLTPDIFDRLAHDYDIFLKTADLAKDEFCIPTVISDAKRDGVATIRVYHNTDRWYGITYREDLAGIQEAIGGLIRDGMYEGI